MNRYIVVQHLNMYVIRDKVLLKNRKRSIVYEHADKDVVMLMAARLNSEEEKKHANVRR
jgi:hypothetical protein